MSSAWRDHNPGDGNVNTNVLARLDKIVESTRLEVDHVLRTSGDKFSHRVLWRPDKTIHSIQYLPRSIYLSRTVSPQGDAICPPGLAACSTTASTWRHGGKGWSHVIHTKQWTTRPCHARSDPRKRVKEPLKPQYQRDQIRCTS